MKMRTLCLLLVGFSTVLAGCASTQVGNPEGDAAKATTVGLVQREIRVGMSGAQVAEILGSPNVVTTDEKRREVWIYDKVSTDSASTTTKAGVFLLILGASSSSSSRSTTQKTLTVVIKFDEGGLVRDFAYHYSKF